jgi:hypothetical protein
MVLIINIVEPCDYQTTDPKNLGTNQNMSLGKSSFHSKTKTAKRDCSSKREKRKKFGASRLVGNKLLRKRWKMGAGTSKGGSNSPKQPFLLSAQVQSFLSFATYAQLISYACVSHTSPLPP